MQKVSEILRLIALALLFGGSSAVVFVAITLVKWQTAAGIPVAEAAANNAPAFIEYAKVVTGAAIMLLAAEAIDFSAIKRGLKQKTKMTFARYGVSAVCAITAFVFSFAIMPPMKELQPLMKTDEAKAQEFRKLHEVSRAVFGATILFALISLLMPACCNTPAKE